MCYFSFVRVLRRQVDGKAEIALRKAALNKSLHVSNREGGFKVPIL